MNTDDLLALCAEALEAAAALAEAGRNAVASAVLKDGKADAAALEAGQFAAHGYAWLATYASALRQLLGWAARLDQGGQLGVPRRSSVIALLGLMPNAEDRGRLAIVTAGFIPIRMRLQVTKAGVRLAAQAIDRAKGGAANRRHILKFLPAGNLLPPNTTFWAGRDCTRRTRRASRASRK